MPAIEVFTHYPELANHAEALATQLSLPMAATEHAACDFLLVVTPDYIGLQTPTSRAKPFYIDFLSAASRYRQKNSSIRNENLARALGLKNHKPDKIIDATAGLGRDSFVIASIGITVEMIERSSIINVLLNDALHRATHDPQIEPIIQRMHLHQGNAVELLTTLERADVIYIDPMFPERRKSALVKKDMQIFHNIIGHDLDADQLLNVALTCALKRVVVKRPKLAAHLAELAPAYSIKGNSSRFDVYLI